MQVYRRGFRGIRIVSFDRSIFEKFETKEYMRKYLNQYNSLKSFHNKEIFITVFNRPYRSNQLENEILKRLIDTTKVNKVLEKKLADADKIILEMYQLIGIIQNKDRQINRLKSRVAANLIEIETLKTHNRQLEKIEHSRAKTRRKNKTGKPGRPRANIDMNKVMKMKAQGMKESHIAKYFGVARSTMNKYVKEYEKNCV